MTTIVTKITYRNEFSPFFRRHESKNSPLVKIVLLIAFRNGKDKSPKITTQPRK
jgi:hypothetical protein